MRPIFEQASINVSFFRVERLMFERNIFATKQREKIFNSFDRFPLELIQNKYNSNNPQIHKFININCQKN